MFSNWRWVFAVSAVKSRFYRWTSRFIWPSSGTTWPVSTRATWPTGATAARSAWAAAATRSAWAAAAAWSAWAAGTTWSAWAAAAGFARTAGL